MDPPRATKQSQSAKRDPAKADSKSRLDEGYMKIPPHITDQFGDQFAQELYDEKKINKPANTIDVRATLFGIGRLVPLPSSVRSEQSHLRCQPTSQ